MVTLLDSRASSRGISNCRGGSSFRVSDGRVSFISGLDTGKLTDGDLARIATGEDILRLFAAGGVFGLDIAPIVAEFDALRLDDDVFGLIVFGSH